MCNSAFGLPMHLRLNCLSIFDFVLVLRTKRKLATKAYTPLSDVEFSRESAEKHLSSSSSSATCIACWAASPSFTTGSILSPYGTKSSVADTKLSSEASDKYSESSLSAHMEHDFSNGGRKNRDFSPTIVRLKAFLLLYFNMDVYFGTQTTILY